MKKYLFLIFVCLMSTPGLFAQSPTQAAWAWQNCDFGKFGVPPVTKGGKEYHIAMLGNSNGALWMVPPEANSFDFSKRWERYLVPTPKTGGAWRVLHTAVPGLESWMLRDRFQVCMDDFPSSSFRDKFPMRIWLQIGGNDVLQSGKLASVTNEYLPHLAHYQLNGILNNIGDIVYTAQRHGRTVLLVSYFPLPKYQAWKGEERLHQMGYARLCPGETLGELEENPDQWALEGGLLDKKSVYCNPVMAEVVGAMFNMVVKANIPFLSPLLNDEMRSWQLRDLDNEYGRMLGMDTSLSGFFKHPGRSLQKGWDHLRGHKRPRVQLGIAQAWEWITHQPRGIVGWELVNVLPNEHLADSVMVHRLGQRFREIYQNQSTHITGGRGTVSFLDIAPHFYDYNSHFPPQYVGRDELYADDKHINSEGFKLYGNSVAVFMNQADYDIYFSDEEYTKAHARPPVHYNTDPGRDDLGLLIACILFGLCSR